MLDFVSVENGNAYGNGSTCTRRGRRNYGSLPDIDRQSTKESYKNRSGRKQWRWRIDKSSGTKKTARVPRRGSQKRRAIFRAVGKHRYNK